MRIAIIGGGYVGLVTGACFSDFGVEVAVVEADPAKLDVLQQGRIPIYEPGLDALVATNMEAGRLSFGGDIGAAVTGADVVFLAVGTPSRRGDGHSDLSYVFAAVEQLAPHLQDGAVVVTKSTVPVGAGRRIWETLRDLRPDIDVDVASNPEFLREGSAIGDFMRPDRVVIGTDSERARAILKRLYRPLYLIETPIVFTGLETAELVKYAANTFLAMKITFINEIADLCEKVGADVHDIARGIGLDSRIGRKFLHPGPGFGGSCFPKDTLALVRTAQDAGAPIRLAETVVSVNDARKAAMGGRIVAACGGSVRGRVIAVLGLAFKPETDDMRDAPAISIVHRLVQDGALVRVFDPVAMTQARALLTGKSTYCNDWMEAVRSAHAVVIATEWNEFRSIPPHRLRALMQGRTVVDLRNVFDPIRDGAGGFRLSPDRPVGCRTCGATRPNGAVAREEIRISGSGKEGRASDGREVAFWILMRKRRRGRP